MTKSFPLDFVRALAFIALAFSLPAFGLERSAKPTNVDPPEKARGAGAVADGKAGDPVGNGKAKTSPRSRSLEKSSPRREEPTVSGGEIGRSPTDSGNSAR